MQSISQKSKEEIYKCSKCGLCQSVCPLFLVTKNELFSPRGRFIVLNNHINNGVKLSKEFIKNLDFCLNCNLCKQFCPSAIDTNAIITELKEKSSKKSYSFIFNVKFFYLKYGILKYVYRFSPFKSFFIGSFLDELFDVKIKRIKASKSSLNKGKVVFFEGCYNKYINGSDKNAVLNTLSQMGYEVKTISSCCGYPELSGANITSFKKNIQKIISSLPSDCEYIICSCDTCFETLKRAKQYVCDIDFDSKLIRFDDFLQLNNYSVERESNTYYFEPLIREEKNQYINKFEILSKKGLFSLMENFFFFRYPKISKKIAKQLDFSQIDNGEKNIITTCNITKLGLKRILDLQNKKNKIYSFAEYIQNKKA